MAQKGHMHHRYERQLKNTDTKAWFLSKVNFYDPLGAQGDCWLWIPSKTITGCRGQVTWQGNTITAPRFAYMLFKDQWDIPGDVFVCHTCDRPACVNPSHLWLGTAKDNSQDMVIKGRHADYVPFKQSGRDFTQELIDLFTR